VPAPTLASRWSCAAPGGCFRMLPALPRHAAPAGQRQPGRCGRNAGQVEEMSFIRPKRRGPLRAGNAAPQTLEVNRPKP
jgi:hypothetical protein